MSNNLYFTVGLPRSSKGTLAQKWLKFHNFIDDGEFQEYEYYHESHRGDFIDWRLHYHQDNEFRVVVSGDAIRESLGSLWNPDVEDYVDAIKYTMVRALLKTGHTVLIDETNTSERSIRRILELDIGAQVAVVPTSKEECLKRIGENKSLIKPIERMWNNLCDLIVYNCDYLENGSKITLKAEYVVNAVKRIRQEVIDYKERYTNEPIGNATTKSPELPKVPTISEASRAAQTGCWSYTSPIVPEPNFQVY